MSLAAVFLDAGPLGIATGRPGTTEPDACRAWLYTLANSGISVIVPEIADYEVRRELIRAGKIAGVGRLDALHQSATYLPLATEAMREAARLWAQVRNAGQVTAPPLALDADAILAGQVLDFCRRTGTDLSDTMVASVNVRHLSRFVPTSLWSSISGN